MVQRRKRSEPFSLNQLIRQAVESFFSDSVKNDGFGRSQSDAGANAPPEHFVDRQSTGVAKPLRGYQTDACKKILDSLDPSQPQLLHLATGGGKTRVANEIVARRLSARGGRVFWVAKDWRLLEQAAADLRSRNRGLRLARYGGQGGTIPPLEAESHYHVLYSTIQTLSRTERVRIFARVRPSLLVWDESHWGEHGEAQRILKACHRYQIPILGLTATPRGDTRFKIAYSRDFATLIRDGVLARPIVQPVRTGISWRPKLARSTGGDISEASLAELADDDQRNLSIVDYYVRNAARLGKAIVFACTVEHVDELVRKFTARGIAARGMHYRKPDSDNQAALDDFRSGAAQVVVNREMLTHGVDVPDARSVFLCRPTTSDILFSQMIGRAARAHPTKSEFLIVEFTDNVASFGGVLVNSQAFFKGSGFSDSGGGAPKAATYVKSPHTFDPAGELTWIPPDRAIPTELHGLWFRKGQTFGIEFELSKRAGVPVEGSHEWLRIAHGLHTTLRKVLPRGTVHSHGISQADPLVWNVKYDASAGWEVTSRILQDLGGFKEIAVACRALNQFANEHKLIMNVRTGTHVHLGWKGLDVAELKRALALVRLFEPGLASIVAPSRIAHFENGYHDTQRPNRFCRPVSAVFSGQKLSKLQSFSDVAALADAEDARYVTFNVRPLGDIQTVEVRLHHGTLNAGKILLWVSLWQQLLWAAQYPRREIEPVRDIEFITPGRDLLVLAREYLVPAEQAGQQGFLDKLSQRRSEIVETWRRFPRLSAWVKASAKW